MLSGSNFMKIADFSIKEITQRLANLKMVSRPSVELNPNSEEILFILVKGDYEVFLLFRAEERVMRAIAENMKKGAIVNPGDIAIYVMEYFNIFCGHVVSSYNKLTHSSARFGIPQYLHAKALLEHPIDTLEMDELCYTCGIGPAKIQTYFKQESQ